MKFILGMAVGAALLVVAVVLYFVLGIAPAATGDKPMPFEKTIASLSLDAHIKHATEQPSPVPPDEKNLLAGADEYTMDCAGCHGLPGQKDKSAIASGMFPRPPQLFHGKGISDDPIWETYWKVENGIRLTGMPAFKGGASETAIWQVSELLSHSNDLPDSVKKELAAATK